VPGNIILAFVVFFMVWGRWFSKLIVKSLTFNWELKVKKQNLYNLNNLSLVNIINPKTINFNAKQLSLRVINPFKHE
jgi:hypothetical protein